MTPKLPMKDQFKIPSLCFSAIVRLILHFDSCKNVGPRELRGGED